MDEDLSTPSSRNEPPTIFVSYCNCADDDEGRKIVERHLRVLKMTSDLAIEIDLWSDKNIKDGEDWHQKIIESLKKCSVTVLLVSADYLGSEFCMKKEVPIILQRKKNDKIMVAPVLLRPCPWKLFSWLSSMQIRPREGRPLLGMEKIDQEAELAELAEGIHDFLCNSNGKIRDRR